MKEKLGSGQLKSFYDCRHFSLEIHIPGYSHTTLVTAGSISFHFGVSLFNYFFLITIFFQPVFHTIVFSLLLYVLDQRDIGALSMKCSCTQR